MKLLKKKRPNGNRAKLLLMLAGIIIAIGLFIFCIIYLLTNYQRREFNFSPSSQEEPVVEISIPEGSYVIETCYDGSKELDPLVFSYPFEKAGGVYIKNKELIEILGETKVEQLQQRVTDFVTEYFQIDSRTLISEYQEKENKLKSFYPTQVNFVNENEKENSISTYASDYLKAVADAELQTEISFVTDKSLVFQNFMGYYVRGVLEIKVFNCNKEVDLSDYYSWEIREGNTYKVIVDIALFEEDSRVKDTYKVSVVEVIDIFIQE